MWMMCLLFVSGSLRKSTTLSRTGCCFHQFFYQLPIILYSHHITPLNMQLFFRKMRKITLPFFLFCQIGFCSAQWPRWEERMLDCTSRTGDCVLIAPNAQLPRDPARYRCRREPMPQSDWNPLARNTTTRLACPIACEPDADLSVIQKKPIQNKNCQKYYTYGKYRDRAEGEWYLWLAEPCVANLTTHCRFNDIPLQSKRAKERREIGGN